MGVTPATLNRAIAAAKSLEAQGYFEKVAHGDQKAASLFARLTAYTLNPSGSEGDYGCLSKSPGETQVDGFAEDAIVFTNDPDDRMNVVDLVNGAGAPGASIGGAVKERREHNRWVKPVPLSDAQMQYLRAGATPPVPPTYPTYEALGGDEGGKKLTRVLEHDYKWAGKPGLDGECGAWPQRVNYDFLTRKVDTVEASTTKHRDGWLTALGLIRFEDGMQANSYVCRICEARVSVVNGQPIPLLPHAANCQTKEQP